MHIPVYHQGTEPKTSEELLLAVSWLKLDRTDKPCLLALHLVRSPPASQLFRGIAIRG